MKVDFEAHREFDRRIKHLAKKYKSINNDIRSLVKSLKENPLQGASLGNNTRKVRMAIMSKGGGKSGGARVITYTITEQAPDVYKITLLTIYDKSEMESVSDAYIDSLISTLPKGLN